jgi:hypothetical protein
MAGSCTAASASGAHFAHAPVRIWNQFARCSTAAQLLFALEKRELADLTVERSGELGN